MALESQKMQCCVSLNVDVYAALPLPSRRKRHASPSRPTQSCFRPLFLSPCACSSSLAAHAVSSWVSCMPAADVALCRFCFLLGCRLRLIPVFCLCVFPVGLSLMGCSSADRLPECGAHSCSPWFFGVAVSPVLALVLRLLSAIC